MDFLVSRSLRRLRISCHRSALIMSFAPDPRIGSKHTLLELMCGPLSKEGVIFQCPQKVIIACPLTPREFSRLTRPGIKASNSNPENNLSLERLSCEALPSPHGVTSPGGLRDPAGPPPRYSALFCLRRLALFTIFIAIFSKRFPIASLFCLY